MYTKVLYGYLLAGCVPFVQAASQAYTFTTVKANGIGAVSVWNNTIDFDYAGNNPAAVVRLGYTTDSPPLAKQVALSSDSGATWVEHPNAYGGNWQQGKIALSADGQTVLWAWSNGGCYASYQQNLFGLSYVYPGSGVIASDKRNASVFYAAYQNKFYLSTYRAVIFQATTGTTGSSTKANKIVVNPQVTGDVWVSTDTGLYRTTDSGSTFTAVSGFTEAWSIALGAPAKAGGYSVFAAANYKGVKGLFRSDDQGVSWAQINDATYDFGDLASVIVSADLRTHGRIYISANGKIVYGDIA